MKIQDVLLEGGRDEEKIALTQRHTEILKEIKEKNQRKIEAKERNNRAKMAESDREQDLKNYTESLERIRAAAIAARIARGEEIARAQKDFLNTNYPDMLNDANIVKSKIEKVFDMLKKEDKKEEAEKLLQKMDSKLLALPYGAKNETVFDKAVKIVNAK